MNIGLGEQLLLLTFFNFNNYFAPLYFVKLSPIFVTLTFLYIKMNGLVLPKSDFLVLMNIGLGEQLLLFFDITSIFKPLYFVKISPIVATLAFLYFKKNQQFPFKPGHFYA